MGAMMRSEGSLAWFSEPSRISKSGRAQNLADRHYIAMVGDGFPFLEGSVTEWTTVENSGTVECHARQAHIA